MACGSSVCSPRACGLEMRSATSIRYCAACAIRPPARRRSPSSCVAASGAFRPSHCRRWIRARPGADKPDTGLRVTWLGHSTVLIEIDGLRVLTDPVWGQRASPSRLPGPKRFQPVPGRAARAAAARPRASSRTITTTISTIRRSASSRSSTCRSSHRSASARTSRPGASRRSASPSSTGGNRYALPKRICQSPPRRRNISPAAVCTIATRRCGRRCDPHRRATQCSSAATPVSPRSTPRFASGSDRSTS